MRTVLITGGSRGIGAACVRAFTQAGWRAAFLYRASEAEAEALVAATGALAIRADIADSAQVSAACETALGQLRHIDALINNAGVSLISALQDTTDDEWRRVLDVNLTGAFYVTRALLPRMLSAGGGRIVNVSSIWGQVGGSMEVAYSAAKAGLLGFTKALAQEVGPSGITVNAVAPGATRTDMLTGYDEPTLDAIAREAPLGRLCEPSEIARVALWLCGDDAAMITGQVIGVSGGRVIVQRHPSDAPDAFGCVRTTTPRRVAPPIRRPPPRRTALLHGAPRSFTAHRQPRGKAPANRAAHCQPRGEALRSGAPRAAGPEGLPLLRNIYALHAMIQAETGDEAWPVEEMIVVAFEGRELGDERLSQVAGGRSIGGYLEYTVIRGDTVATVAGKFHVTERDICDLNGIDGGSALYLGQILKVPVRIRC